MFAREINVDYNGYCWGKQGYFSMLWKDANAKCQVQHLTAFM